MRTSAKASFVTAFFLLMSCSIEIASEVGFRVLGFRV